MNEVSINSRRALARAASDERVLRLRQILGTEAKLHLVGGTVRDLLLGAEGVDIDLASALLPEILSAKLGSAGVQIIPTGLAHQTITAVPVPGRPAVEITTFRGAGMSPEGGVSAGRSIEEDLRYRDFTINALAYDISTERLIDETGGLSDLKGRLVRAVGVPKERYAEDPLRVLRMVRFSCKDGFSLDEQSKSEAKEFAGRIPALAVERVREEFSKILCSERFAYGLELLLELDFLPQFLPEISRFKGFEQNSFHRHDLWDHTLLVVSQTRPELILRLAALFHDVSKPDTLSVDEQGERHFYRHEEAGAQLTRKVLERLRYSNAQIEGAVTLVRTHMRPLDCGPGGMRRLLRDTEGLFDKWRELKEADASAVYTDQEKLADELKNFDEAMEVVKRGPNVSPLKNLAIGGKDLISLGLIPGPRFGELLRALHERVLDQPELNSRETLLAMAREMEGLPEPEKP